MTLSKTDLIERFLSGATAGRASREEIKAINGYRCIVGYGWAVYAADLVGEYALFGDGYKTRGTHVGWAGYSGTTTGHLQEIKGVLEAKDAPYRVVGGALTESKLAKGDFDLEAYVEENEVEPREATGYLYRQ